MAMYKCYVIRIYIPVQLDELGDKKVQLSKPLRHLPHVAQIIEVIASSQRVGRLGNYSNVYEITEGEEWYTPHEEANPGLGHPNQESGVHSVVLTTYAVNIERSELDAFVAEIVKVHPWEHPVVECIGPEGAFVWLPDSHASAISSSSQTTESSFV